MANKTMKKATVNTNTKEATTMKKVKAVTPKSEEKTVETKKVEAKAPATKEKKVAAKKENAAKIDLSMTDFEAMLKEANIGFKPNNCEYRILKSNTAIHILKTKIYINCTNEDFKTISEQVKDENMKLEPTGNACDDKRPGRVEFTSIETLKAILKAIAANNAVVVAA